MEALIFPEGVSDVTGRLFHRSTLAGVAMIDHGFVNVVTEFTGGLQSDILKSIGTAKNFVLKEGGIYADIQFHARWAAILEDIQAEGHAVNLKIAPAYLGKFSPLNGLEVTDITEIIELKLVSV